MNMCDVHVVRGGKMAIKGMLREIFFSGNDGEMAELAALCPACGFEHNFRVDLEGHGKWKDNVWTFDGNYDAPTFSPSMLSNQSQIQKEHPVCHSFVRNGEWQYLGDCTHEMAGQTVPMIPPDPDATFEKQHGWHLYPWTDDEGKPVRGYVV